MFNFQISRGKTKSDKNVINLVNSRKTQKKHDKKENTK